MSDYISEAEALSEMYDDDFEDAEWIAEKQYQRRNTIATLMGLSENSFKKPKDKSVYIIIQDSRKDDTTLMLVDRRKSKKYWWTHDFSLALKDGLDEMKKVAKRLKRNNVRVVEYNEYLMST